MAARSLGSLTVDLILKASGFAEGWTAAERDADKAQRKISSKAKQASKEVSDAWDGAAKLIGTTFAGVSVGMIFSEMVGVAKQTAEAAAEIERFSKLSNTTAQDFQRLAAGANTVGVSSEKMADIFKDVQDKVGDFIQTGGGGLADFFEQVAPKVGVTAEQFRKLSGPDALQLYVSSLEKANLSQSDLVFYMEAIASDSANLLPLLKDQGAAWQALGDRAEAYGAILSGESLAAAKAYKTESDNLSLALKGLQTEIAAGLLPSLTDMNSSLASPEVQAGIRRTISALADMASGVVDLGTEFALGMKYADGFWDALFKYGLSNPFKDAESQIGELGKEIDKERERAENFSFFWTEAQVAASEKRIADLEQQRAYYSELDKLASQRVTRGIDPTMYDAPTAEAGGPSKLSASFTKPAPKGKSQAEKDREAAEKYVLTLREQAEAVKALSATEKLAYDLGEKKVKLTATQSAQAREYAALIDQRTQFEKAAAEFAKESARVSEEYGTNERLREEIELIGKNEYELHSLNRQRQEAVILVKEQHLAELNRAADLTGTMTAQQANLQSEIELLRERLSLTDDEYAARETDRVAKATLDPIQKGVDAIAQSLTDQLMTGGKSFGEYLKSLGRTQIFQPLLQGGANSAVGALGGGTSATGILSNASSIYSAFTGGLTNTLATSIGQLGTTFGSEALSSFALGMKSYLPAGVAGPTMQGAGGAAGAGSQFASAAGGAAAFAAVAALVLNAVGAFRTDTKIGGGIQGTLGGEINAWEERRKGGTLFSGPSFSTFDPTGELEKQRAKLEELRAAGEGASATAQTLQTVIDSLEEQYGKLAAATTAQDKILQASYTAMRTNAAGMADVLGVSSDAVKSFTSEVKINFEGLDAEGQQSAVAEALAKANNELAQQVLGTWKTTSTEVVRVLSENIGSYGEDASLVFSEIRDTVTSSKYVTSEYAKEGERAIDTLTRLTTSLQTVRDVADVMSVPFYAAGLAGADAASKIADAFGGLQGFAESFSTYIDAYYTEDERRAQAARASARALSTAGLDVSPEAIMGATRESVRGFVDVVLQEFGPTSPQYVAAVRQANALAGIFPTLDSVAKDAEAAAKSAADAARDSVSDWAKWLSGMRDAMDQAGTVWDQLGAAMGGSGNAYSLSKEARLWSAISEGSYAQQIEMADELAGLVLARHQAESKAAEDQIKFARGLGAYVDKLLTGDLSPLTLGEKLAEAQRQAYATYEAAAGGDVDAQARLQNEANTYLQLAQQAYTSGEQYKSIFNTVTTALSSLSTGTMTEAQQQLNVSTDMLGQMQALRTVLEDAYFGMGDELAEQAALLTDQTLVNAMGFDNVANAIFDLPALIGVELNRTFQPTDTANTTQLSIVQELAELRKAVESAREQAAYHAQAQVQATLVASGQNAATVSRAVTDTAYNQQLNVGAIMR